ncbi:hypothetical protein E2N92_03405 [Methanofollis formosanus]|uniref:Uncharacterized protein n=1 Tax=Methanofollis formosanus TaxID=299308 RepID=A0A8G1A164_9EURY|nr:hypothetical protein [Methanofollis formosanus]QYZ78543.1 hypothetical protein E2N92_03405 [Methanofollis formosanus]
MDEIDFVQGHETFITPGDSWGVARVFTAHEMAEIKRRLAVLPTEKGCAGERQFTVAEQL